MKMRWVLVLLLASALGLGQAWGEDGGGREKWRQRQRTDRGENRGDKPQKKPSMVERAGWVLKDLPAMQAERARHEEATHRLKEQIRLGVRDFRIALHEAGDDGAEAVVNDFKATIHAVAEQLVQEEIQHEANKLEIARANAGLLADKEAEHMTRMVHHMLGRSDGESARRDKPREGDRPAEHHDAGKQPADTGESAESAESEDLSRALEEALQ